MKAGQEPAVLECRTGVLKGGDTGEFEPATVGSSSTAILSGVVGNGSAGAAGEGG